MGKLLTLLAFAKSFTLMSCGSAIFVLVMLGQYISVQFLLDVC
jgi:hypothetical protein